MCESYELMLTFPVLALLMAGVMLGRRTKLSGDHSFQLCLTQLVLGKCRFSPPWVTPS